MPPTEVIFYQESEDDVPVLDWLKDLRRSDVRAYESCVAAIDRLADFGHELRRPLADILRDGVYELRIRKGRVKLPNPILLSWQKLGDSWSRIGEGRPGAER